MEVNLDELVVPAFRKVFSAVLNNELSGGELVCKGGRNSTKSVVLGYLCILYLLKMHQSVAALVLHNNRVQSRLLNNLLFCLDKLGVRHLFKLRKSPAELVLLNPDGTESDCSIVFLGAENPEVLKSLKSRDGSGFGLIFFEEASNFRAYKDIQNIKLTLLRGTAGVTLYSYNPPKDRSLWINSTFNYAESDEQVEDFGDGHSLKRTFTYKVNGEERTAVRIVHSSSYLDVVEEHPDWLGSAFLAEAEQAKESNEDYYKNVFLGQSTGSDANVFHNIHDWTYNVEDLKSCDTSVHRGLDHSNGGADPTGFIVCYYQKTRKLFIVDEYYKAGADVSIDGLAAALKSRVKDFDVIYGDSAQPLLNRELSNRGVPVMNCKKYPGSVKSGVHFLQGLQIYIDKVKTPNAWREFNNYSYLIDKDTDEVTSELQDKDNHLIDACRYALQDVIRFGV